MEKSEGLLGGISVELAGRILMFLPDEDLLIWDPVDANATLKIHFFPHLSPAGPESF